MPKPGELAIVVNSIEPPDCTQNFNKPGASTMIKHPVGDHPDTVILADGSGKCERCGSRVNAKQNDRQMNDPGATRMQFLAIDCSPAPGAQQASEPRARGLWDIESRFDVSVPSAEQELMRQASRSMFPR